MLIPTFHSDWNIHASFAAQAGLVMLMVLEFLKGVTTDAAIRSFQGYSAIVFKAEDQPLEIEKGNQQERKQGKSPYNALYSITGPYFHS